MARANQRPTNPRPPALEKYRWWSNPNLSDPDTVIATVLADPTTVDLARIIGTYGLSRVEGVRDRISHELTPSEARWLETLWEPVTLGAQDASRMPVLIRPAKCSSYEQTATHPIGKVDDVDEDGIFRLKSRLLMDRRTSQDLFDLWLFIQERGRSVADILDAMDERTQHRTMDDLLQMIAPRSLPARDPGFETSLPGAPKTSAELLGAMTKLVAAHRRMVAAHEISALSPGPKDGTIDIAH